MNSYYTMFLIACPLVVSGVAKEFANLGFEDGQIPIPPIHPLQPADLVLPGWTARMGDNVLSEVGFGGNLSEHGNVTVNFDSPAFEGRFGLHLSGGPELGTAGPKVPASVSQVGLIPANARSLIFDGVISGGSVTEIRLDGTLVPLNLIASSPEKFTYALDVSPFAGREVELRLMNYAPPDQLTGGAYIDTLRFSSTVVVPEPASWLLLSLGFSLWLVCSGRIGTHFCSKSR